MRTLKSHAADVAGRLADDNLANFIGTVEERQRIAKRSKPNPGARRRQYIEEARQRAAAQDWKGATSGMLVALYWVCHVKVYGTEPSELDSAATWTKAMKAAGSLVKVQFDGDVQVAIKFMRWLWTREASREQWRKANNTGGRRITWIQNFCYVSFVSDWRTEKVRKGA